MTTGMVTLAEFYFIDGTALAASDFGELDSDHKPVDTPRQR